MKAAGVGVATTVALALAMVLFGHPLAGDAHHYLAMSAHPFTFEAAPWGYRILTPLIVHVLPASHELGFEIVTVGTVRR